MVKSVLLNVVSALTRQYQMYVGYRWIQKQYRKSHNGKNVLDTKNRIQQIEPQLVEEAMVENLNSQHG